MTLPRESSLCRYCGLPLNEPGSRHGVWEFDSEEMTFLICSSPVLVHYPKHRRLLSSEDTPIPGDPQ